MRRILTMNRSSKREGQLNKRANNGKTLLRVRPRGFCAGVVRAVDIVELALEAYGSPVYVHHEIVHNRYVVDQLRQRGAIFVETLEEVPIGAVLVFSAHGVPPTVRDVAKTRSEERRVGKECRSRWSPYH